MRIGEMIAPFGPGSETLGADTAPGPEGAPEERPPRMDTVNW